jgi:hypothetical protein
MLRNYGFLILVNLKKLIFKGCFLLKTYKQKAYNNNTYLFMEIVIDFDGTVVTHDYPRVGKDIGAVPVLKKLIAAGHNLILFTMRCDGILPNNGDKEVTFLTDAVNWFKDNEIPLYGVQKNPTQHEWTTSPKAYGQLIIDDAAAGCPLIYNPLLSNRQFVNWVRMEEILRLKLLIK